MNETIHSYPHRLPEGAIMFHWPASTVPILYVCNLLRLKWKIVANSFHIPWAFLKGAPLEENDIILYR